MLEWIQNSDTIIWWLVAASVVTFILSIFIVPILIVQIPVDYFSHSRRHPTLWAPYHPLLRMLLLIIKNSFGTVFVAIGAIMLVLPGPGILSILIGIMLLNFPGKYRLERWLVGRPPVLYSINWIRQRADHEPLII